MKKYCSVCLLILVGCFNPDDYLPSNISESDILKKVYASKNPTPADGTTIITIIAELPLNAVRAKSKIKFSTTNGVFSNRSDTISTRPQIVYDSGRNKLIAEVKMRSSIKVDTARINVVVENFSASYRLAFSKAEPEAIRLNLSGLTLPTGYDKTITITTLLSRTVGLPSQFSICDLTVLDSDGNPIGYFLNYNDKTNESGVIINQFTLGKSTYSGILRAVATVRLATGVSITETVSFNAN